MIRPQFILSIALSILILSCGSTSNQTSTFSGSFDDYWYNGQAEITSYNLEQARYGEVHKGTAVTVFVTEDFSKSKLVKLDNSSAAGDDAVPILKLNMTKKFNTGIYPYSMMSSVFTPIERTKNPNTLKTTTSSQEWCGHTFTQLELNGDNYDVQLHSYFESEGEQKLVLSKTWLEDELWNLIRIAPKDLPQGEISIVPGAMFQRLKHVPFRTENASAKITKAQSTSTYTLNYDELGRTLAITFNNDFPHQIISWEESYMSGWGSGAKELTTKATLNKTLKLDYWNKNKLSDSGLRNDLGLD